MAGSTRPCWLMGHWWTPASPLLPCLSHQRTQCRSGGLLRLKGCTCLCVLRAGVRLGPASRRRMATEWLKAAPDYLLSNNLQCLTLRQLQSQVLQLQAPRLCNLSSLLLTKVSLASSSVLRLAFAGSCKMRQCSGRYCNQSLMYGNVTQEIVCMLLCVAGCVACFCLPCQSHCISAHCISSCGVFGQPRQPLCMLQKQLA